MKKTVIILLLFFNCYTIYASHIVGGEIIYDYLGNDDYRITLKIYRDCNSQSPFDGAGIAGPAYITVFDAQNNAVGVYDLGIPVITPVPPAFNNPCITAPNNVCIEEGVYTYTIHLPSQTGGYTIVYQRCCRNANIINLVNSSEQGATYVTKIPGPEVAAVNSSPRFKKFPPIYICRDVKFKFDHAATDPDGDQLVYSLSSPFGGLDPCCPSIALSGSPGSNSSCPSPPAFCPQTASLPPYDPVLFIAPYSGTYPMPSNPAFSIHPSSGELSGTPTVVAQYVVGVKIEEYRNNVLINTHFRDFQFTVIGCTVNVMSAVADQTPQCQGKDLTFTNKSINNSSTPVYHWDFGVPTLNSDTSNVFSPSYSYPDTGIYMLTLITNPGKPCSDTLFKPVYVYPPLDISFTHPERQCFRNNSFNFSPKGIYAAPTTFTWNFGAQASQSISTLSNVNQVSFNEGGLFEVQLLAKQFACRDTFTDTIRVIPKPQAKINNLPGKLCDPATVGFSNGSKSDLPLNYYWTFSNGDTSTKFEPSTVFSPAGDYAATLIIETTMICKDTSMYQVFPIKVYPKPEAAFEVSPKETSIFEPVIKVKSKVTNENSYSANFDFGDGNNEQFLQGTHAYTTYGTYTITQILSNFYGCLDTSYEQIKILPEFRFWIPNAFSPDGNELNDVFMPITFGISNYTFEIFDRWGHRVFLTHNTKEGWDGTFKNKACQQDIYTWKVTYRNSENDEFEKKLGHVMLLRNP